MSNGEYKRVFEQEVRLKEKMINECSNKKHDWNETINEVKEKPTASGSLFPKTNM